MPHSPVAQGFQRQGAGGGEGAGPGLVRDRFGVPHVTAVVRPLPGKALQQEAACRSLPAAGAALLAVRSQLWL